MKKGLNLFGELVNFPFVVGLAFGGFVSIFFGLIENESSELLDIVLTILAVFGASIGAYAVVLNDKRSEIRDTRRADAELMFKSYLNWGNLFESLIVLGNVVRREEKNGLESIDTENFNETLFSKIVDDEISGEVIEENMIHVSMKEWEKIRNIKTHFKSIAQFIDSNYTSNSGVISALGEVRIQNLLHVYRLDVVRYYKIRKSRFLAGKLDLNSAKIEFDSDFRWYKRVIQEKEKFSL